MCALSPAFSVESIKVNEIYLYHDKNKLLNVLFLATLSVPFTKLSVHLEATQPRTDCAIVVVLFRLFIVSYNFVCVLLLLFWLLFLSSFYLFVSMVTISLTFIVVISSNKKNVIKWLANSPIMISHHHWNGNGHGHNTNRPLCECHSRFHFIWYHLIAMPYEC